MANYESNDTIELDNEPIEKVDRYKYLGQTVIMVMLDNHMHTREEVMIRIKAGWSCSGRFKDILCDTRLPMSIRRRMYYQCIIPTMTYAAETYNNSARCHVKPNSAYNAN